MQSLAYFIFAFIFGSFLEYWVHRLMHVSPWFGSKITAHYGHHRSNTTKGFWGDFLDFSLVALLVLPAFFISISIGIIVFSGTLSFAAFASYAHQIQHYTPGKCFWMNMPIHYVHHQHNQWDSNFGLAIDWWDRLFGTYQPVVSDGTWIDNSSGKRDNA
ncbi:sterol desaturase family protein [Waterburya agarophytonicola K14]|uniref:Sterol desaturase family protein n=1 Tax=Waterburya agarophytonicola KI4 TaxID=2874699 RepID=A0A964BPM5_9CYAN|nr:sterol desaturase family protein [Waterburya agarophytonicola]MCC0176027.1 sterol desaturase family protein [Waterburya agarophytonicola KI4]